jgi:hypothetical protein
LPAIHIPAERLRIGIDSAPSAWGYSRPSRITSGLAGIQPEPGNHEKQSGIRLQEANLGGLGIIQLR